MFKRVVRRIKGPVMKPVMTPVLPLLPQQYRGTEALYSIRNSLGRRLFGEDKSQEKKVKSEDEKKADSAKPKAKTAATNTDSTVKVTADTEVTETTNVATGTEGTEATQVTEVKEVAKETKKPEETKSSTVKTDSTAESKTTTSGAKVIVPKTEESKATEKPLRQVFKEEGFRAGIRASWKKVPWSVIIGSVATSLSAFGLHVWKEDLAFKMKLEWAAEDTRQLEPMLIEELNGLMTNVPLKVNGKVTDWPQWGWMWLLGTLPGTLFSLNPWKRYSKNSEARLKTSQATIIPIDFSSTIEKVLNIPPSQFIILDGQKGTGKSTAMLLLCWHEIKNGNPAIFLRLKRDEKKEYEGFMLTKFIKENPFLIQYLAETFKMQRSEFTIVVDDMNKYLKAPETRENATIMIGHLWDATEFLGARVIFPTSDYGLKQAILDLPMHHSARFQQVRMYAPPGKELTETINSGIIGKGHEKVEGNSPADVARYCEVVGTLREMKLNYLTPGTNPLTSVRQVTQVVFNNNLRALPSLVKRVVSAQDDKKKAGEHISPESLYTKADVKKMLIAVCKNQYIDADDEKTYAVGCELAQANILRPVCGYTDTFEFHSFQIEVAIRAILDLPATLKPTPVHGSGQPESSGRGSTETISVLKTGEEKYESLKRRFNRILS